MSSYRPCLNLTDFKCFSNIFYKNEIESCATKYCPLECSFVIYDFSVSSLIYPNTEIFSNWCTDMPTTCDPSLTYDQFRTRFITINVYYSSLTFTKINVTPTMTFTGLLAAIGGSMSLIVGISCFTVFEIGELFVLFICELCKKN